MFMLNRGYHFIVPLDEEFYEFLADWLASEYRLASQ